MGVSSLNFIMAWKYESLYVKMAAVVSWVGNLSLYFTLRSTLTIETPPAKKMGKHFTEYI